MELIVYLSKVVLIFFIVIKFLDFIIPRAGGAGFAMLIFVLMLMYYWAPLKTRLGTDSYDSERKDEMNPLYKKGIKFRKRNGDKRGSIFTADMKWDYFCQIMSVPQIIAFVIYGIYSALHDFQRFEKVEIILSAWALVSFLLTYSLRLYYNLLYDSAYIKTPWNKWNPFTFTGDIKSTPQWIETDFSEFGELKLKLFAGCEENKYHMDFHKKITEEKEIWFFSKMKGHDIKIFEVIRIPSLEKEDMEILNNIFEVFLKQKLKNRKKTSRVYFIFFFCTDGETRAYRNIMNREVIPGIRRHRLPTGITLDNGQIQIADYDIYYGHTAYKRMKDDFFSILKSTGLSTKRK